MQRRLRIARDKRLGDALTELAREPARQANPEVGQEADRHMRARDLLEPLAALGAALELFDAGEVRLVGQTLSGKPPRAIWRLGVGRTFQITATFASMTVRENIQCALISHYGRVWSFWRAARHHFTAEADALLAQVGMLDQADRPCGVLAYGDLKRVELAMALANDPQLLLMDEPTAGMAPSERIALMELTRSLVRARGLACLFTEHDMDVVFGHADRILVMNRGALIAEGDAAAVRANLAVREIYLGSDETAAH